MLEFGKKIKKLRKEQGLTGEQLANEFNRKFNTNINKSMISLWENGKKEIMQNNILLYCKYFNVSMDWLVGNDTNTRLTKFEKIESIKKIKEELRNKNINVETLKKTFNISNFDENISDEKLFGIANYYKININKSRYLNKRVQKNSPIRDWFTHCIEGLSDEELLKLKDIMESALKIIQNQGGNNE